MSRRDYSGAVFVGLPLDLLKLVGEYLIRCEACGKVVPGGPIHKNMHHYHFREVVGHTVIVHHHFCSLGCLRSARDMRVIDAQHRLFPSLPTSAVAIIPPRAKRRRRDHFDGKAASVHCACGCIADG